MTVLLVDDNQDVREVLRLMFELDDFDVVGEAESGAEAISVARETQPQFVVLDYMMPGMYGDETAKALREVAPSSQIVAFSAVLDKKPGWADAFVTKDHIGEMIPLLLQLGLPPMDSG
jgi:two-component system, NarL family, invasion response regulator UvrY